MYYYFLATSLVIVCEPLPIGKAALALHVGAVPSLFVPEKKMKP